MFIWSLLLVICGLFGLISASTLKETNKNEHEAGFGGESGLEDFNEAHLNRNGRYFYQSVNTVTTTSVVTATSTCYTIAAGAPTCASSLILLGKRKRRSVIETSPIETNDKIDQLIILPSATSNPSKLASDQHEDIDYLDGTLRSDRQLQLYPFFYTTTITKTTTTFVATKSIILGCTIFNSNFIGSFNGC